MAMINCLRCGVSNRAGSNFCNNCGAELPGAAPPPAPDATEETDPNTATGPEHPPRPERPPPPDQAPFQQPWLLSEEDAAEESADPPLQSTQGDESDEWHRSERLITGVQGLLEPNAIAPSMADPSAAEGAEDGARPSARRSPVDDAELRQLRRWLNTVPPQAQRVDRQHAASRRGSLYLPLLFLLLGLGVVLPILLQIDSPSGTAHAWPGVADSFALIRDLPEGARVLTYWAYDPATAGEMDFVAHPVLTHLVGKRSQLIVASPLPGGPPLLLKLLDQVATETRLAYLDPLPIMIGYLPGGATVLPLLGQAVDQVLPTTAASTAAPSENTPIGTIDLALVVTAQAEDAQAWLEQVQPRNGVPVLVVSSAGADPILRPYWQSGQIAGLVSGFDGGSTYWSLLSNDLPDTSENGSDPAASIESTDENIVVPYAPLLRVRRWMVFQNWGHLIFIVIIVLGNIAGFVQRRQGDGTMPATQKSGNGHSASSGSDEPASSAGNRDDG